VRIFFVFLILFNLSCSSLRFGSKIPREWTSPEELAGYYNSQIAGLESLRGEGMLQIESPQFNERVPVQVLIKAPDSLKIKLEGPLGIDVAQIFVDRNRYLVYLPREEQEFSGTILDLNIDELLYDLGVADLDIQKENISAEELHKEILGFFRGGAILDLDRLTSSNFEDSTRIRNILIYNESASGVYYEFERNRSDLQKVFVHDENGEKRVEKSYRRYVSVSGQRIPKHITATFPQERSRLTIRYTNIRVNKKIDPEEFHIRVSR